MRTKDKSIRPRTHSEGEGSLDGIEFMGTFPQRTSESSESSAEEKIHSPKLRQLHTRINHNELEKSRRAQLKGCLDKLKDVVPMSHDAHKHTTLGLLTKSKHFINTLEEREKRHLALKDQLMKEQKNLKKRLEQLQHLVKGGEIGLGNTILLSANVAEINLALRDKHQPSNSSNNVPHILKRKGFEIAADAIVTEINVEDAESYCLLLDDIGMLDDLEYSNICRFGNETKRGIGTDEQFIELCEVII